MGKIVEPLTLVLYHRFNQLLFRCQQPLHAAMIYTGIFNTAFTHYTTYMVTKKKKRKEKGKDSRDRNQNKSLCHHFNRVPNVITLQEEIKNYQSATLYPKLHVKLRPRTSKYEETS